MYLTCVSHKVHDYARFKEAFDINAALLFERAQCQGTYIVQINGDPTDLAIINLWPSEQHWKDFLTLHGSPEFAGKVKNSTDATAIGEATFWGGTVAE